MTADRIGVFIVDDHPFVREWLGTLLGLEKDIEVVGEAGDPLSAMAAMESRPPDIAIVDLSLKRGSGLELIKAIRSRFPYTRSLVLSMHEEISDVERALRAGARGYVMKGESTGQIVVAISAADVCGVLIILDLHFQLISVLNNVEVGQDVTFSVDNRP